MLINKTVINNNNNNDDKKDKTLINKTFIVA